MPAAKGLLIGLAPPSSGTSCNHTGCQVAIATYIAVTSRQSEAYAMMLTESYITAIHSAILTDLRSPGHSKPQIHTITNIPAREVRHLDQWERCDIGP